jgi:hypothetical protein
MISRSLFPPDFCEFPLVAGLGVQTPSGSPRPFVHWRRAAGGEQLIYEALRQFRSHALGAGAVTPLLVNWVLHRSDDELQRLPHRAPTAT